MQNVTSQITGAYSDHLSFSSHRTHEIQWRYRDTCKSGCRLWGLALSPSTFVILEEASEEACCPSVDAQFQDACVVSVTSNNYRGLQNDF